MSSLVEASRLTRPPSEMPQPISVSCKHSKPKLSIATKDQEADRPPLVTESDVHMEDAGLSNSPASTVEGDSKSHTPTPRNPKSRIPEVLEPPAPETQLEVLSGDMRGMVDLINNLRSQGIEDLGLPLPRIAVVGNQSAGKSSLIEAISGVCFLLLMLSYRHHQTYACLLTSPAQYRSRFLDTRGPAHAAPWRSLSKRVRIPHGPAGSHCALRNAM